ncbi:MAG: KUP/HAK/KT family potassium transporter, partial [Gammaproteobacteria bacterium]|nr:KUP/HAK/KT family potassium transporter [Gammaproteobacteria bacterium]
IALLISFVMLTWRRGEHIMASVRLALRQSSAQFLGSLSGDPPLRLPGTAVVLGRMARGVPLALTQNLKYNRVLHTHVFLVAVGIAEIPWVADAERAEVTPIGAGLTRVELHFGFMEHPDVPGGLAIAQRQGKIDLGDARAVSYYTGHETITALGVSRGMARWREGLFAFMHRNSQRPGTYFRIPPRQIMEIGVEFEI